MNLSKRKQKGLILLIGILVGIFIFFGGGFQINKNISQSGKEKVKIEVKTVVTPILYRFFS